MPEKSTVAAKTDAAPAAPATTPDAGKAPPNTPPPPAPEPERKIDSKAFAALSHAEKRAQQRAKEADERIARADAREKELQAALARVEKFEADRKRFAEDPEALFDTVGVPFQQVVDSYIAKGKAPKSPIELEMQKLRAEQEAFRAEREAEAKAKQEAEDKALEQVRVQYLDQCKQFVQDHADKYELTIANDRVDLVSQVVQEQYNRDGRILAPDVAAELVERYCERLATEKLSKSSKLRKLIEELDKATAAAKAAEKKKAEPAEPSPPQAQSGTAATPRTLTNALVSNVATRVQYATPKGDQLLQQAIAKARGEAAR